jgi:hypothetical protein
MTDVIAEIAESGFRTKNPMSGIDQVDDEDTEAAVVPDFFAFAREVFTTGEPHWQVSRAVRVGQGCGILSFTISVLNSLHILLHGYDIEVGLGEDPESWAASDTGSQTLQLLEGLFRGIAPLWYIPLATEFVSVVHPTEGHLVKLGAGTQKVSEKAVRRLEFWRKCAWLGVAGVIGFMLFVTYFLYWGFR